MWVFSRGTIWEFSDQSFPAKKITVSCCGQRSKNYSTKSGCILRERTYTGGCDCNRMMRRQTFAKFWQGK